MDIGQIVKSIRRPRKQKGQRIETPTAWMLRYYVDGKQKCITLPRMTSTDRGRMSSL